MSPVNVLYAGMALDIITPLELVPHLDNLYVMDLFDGCYVHNYDKPSDITINDQRNDIIEMLVTGYFFISDGEGGIIKIQKLPAKIISDVRTDTKWILIFNFEDKIRNLTVYTMEYQINEWPKEINNLQYIFSIGAAFSCEDDDKERENCISNITRMIKTRTTQKFIYIIGIPWGTNQREVYNVCGDEKIKLPTMHQGDNTPYYIECKNNDEECIKDIIITHIPPRKYRDSLDSLSKEFGIQKIKSIKRKSIKRKSRKIKSIKRKSRKRKSIKIKSIKRKSIKIKSIKRK